MTSTKVGKGLSGHIMGKFLGKYQNYVSPFYTQRSLHKQVKKPTSQVKPVLSPCQMENKSDKMILTSAKKIYIYPCNLCGKYKINDVLFCALPFKMINMCDICESYNIDVTVKMNIASKKESIVYKDDEDKWLTESAHTHAQGQ
jgi:hypothetical protein